MRNSHMRPLLSGILAASCFGFAAQADAQIQPTPPAPKPRLTADKKELPAAGPRFVDIKMPVIGNKLGALPEQVCGRLFPFESDVPMVQQTRRDMTKSGIDLDGFNYFGDSAAGFSKCALKVENGRVQRLILWRPSFTDDAARQMIEKIVSDSQMAAKKIGEKRLMFKMSNVKFFVQPVGHWERVIPGGTKQVVGGRHVEMQEIPDTKQAGPGGIEIGFEDFDWRALTITDDPVKLDAIMKGKLLIGMSYAEAYAAMRQYKVYRQKSGQADQVWTWTQKQVDKEDTSVFSGDFGTFTRTTYSSSEKPILRATFKSGVVDSIENDETMSAPPKP